MSVYAEILDSTSEIATEAFSFKELGKNILKFIQTIIGWIRKVIAKVKRWATATIRFKKEKEVVVKEYEGKMNDLTKEEERILAEMDASYEKNKKEHEEKLKKCTNTWRAIQKSLAKLSTRAQIFETGITSIINLRDNKNLEDLYRSNVDNDYSNYQLQKIKFIDFEIDDIPELDSKNFDQTCNDIAYFLASGDTLKKKFDELVKTLIHDLQKAEDALASLCKRIQQVLNTNINERVERELHVKLGQSNKAIATLAKGVQCLDRALSLSVSVRPIYSSRSSLELLIAKKGIMKQGRRAFNALHADAIKATEPFDKGRFSKEYHEYYNDKHPLATD